ncbi:GIY-YIG catalytic domain-containing protein [Faustovirus]|nr:GIY-YIG catalytic domain-containing protein [Faustovirus]
MFEINKQTLDNRRNPETKGLPMYIIAVNKQGLKGFAINGHPLCSYKRFTNKNGRAPSECKRLALKFLRDLEAKGEVYIPKRKADETLPVGITKFRDGYKVRRKINGEWKMKVFMGVKKLDESKLNAAKAYLAEINATIIQ